MKIIHRNFKEGKIKLSPENLDDLWYLKSVIFSGDNVTGVSYRRIKDDEKLRADKGQRVRMFLGLDVKEVEFSPYSSSLRINGIITSGPEDLISYGTYHTMDVRLNDTITIKKTKWLKWHLDRLKEAEMASKAPMVLIVCIEDGEAEFGIVRRYGMDFPVRISVSVSGKRYDKQHDATVKDFYSQVSVKIQEMVAKDGFEVVILCGPGFYKDNLLDYIKQKNPGTAEICHLEATGSPGRVGIQEILKRKVLERIVKEDRLTLETGLVERVFEEVSKGTGLSTYGLTQVNQALEIGAVETLLVSDNFIRKYKNSDGLIEKARNIRAQVIIVSTEHEGGERLEAIGGIAGILRFALR